jgi:hypothetical protein
LSPDTVIPHRFSQLVQARFSSTLTNYHGPLLLIKKQFPNLASRPATKGFPLVGYRDRMENSTLSRNSPGLINFNLTSNSTSVFVDPNDMVNGANAIIMPIFIAITMVVIYPPARDFYGKRNFVACSMIASVTFLNLYQFLNAVI